MVLVSPLRLAPLLVDLLVEKGVEAPRFCRGEMMTLGIVQTLVKTIPSYHVTGRGLPDTSKPQFLQKQN